jgi:ABC-type antimicrobial peptide transport system permease subunit
MADYQIKAFKIDSQTGEITHSNDISSFRGSGQGGVFSNPFRVYRSDFWLRIPVFECGSITLTKMLDPRSMVSFTQAEASSMMVWEFYSHVPPLQFGPTIVSREDVMTFVPPETPLQIKVSLGNTLVSVVSNSSDEFPFGTGYTLESGESLFLSNTPFVLLDNFFRIVDERFITLTSTGVTYSATADLYHGSSAELRLNALNALNNYIYSEAYSGIYQALAFEMSGYDATMQLFFDAIYTVVFFFLLLIPFSYLIERLILTRKGAALRMFTITAIFAAFTLVLYFLHPGFHLATSVYMIVIGFLLAIMAVISLGVIFLTGSGFFKEIRIGYLGPHFSEIARTSAVATALSVGVNNMKRHKLRTILNLITIVMIVFSMISFVSLELLSVIKVFKSPIPPGYEGTLLKGFDVLDTVSSAIPETLSYALGDDVVVSRIWVYPPNLVLPIRGPTGTYEANALLGLEWIEKEFNPVNATIIQGRWFTSFDKYGAIIPKTLIDRSGIEFKDRLINIWGIDFTIVVVFDPNVFDSLTDLDDRTINPIDMFSAIAYGQPVPLSSRDFIIIPAETAKELGGEVRSVAFLKKEGIDLTEFTNDLALQFGGLSVIVGDEGETRQISAGQVTNLLGGNITFPAIGIAMLVLLTTLLGGVVERKREIFVYNVVGLAPRHIQWIFLAEPLIYAIVGASLGYLFGIGGTSILSALNLLPIGFHPNYSAQWVMIAVTASMGIVFVPSLYPNRIVSKTASPTSMRAWKIPTKPVGDIWSIPLPFVENIGQIGGLFSFINEYLGAYRYERAGTFQATQLSYEEKEKSRALKFFTKLIPWDTPSTQWTTIIATTKDGEKFNFELLVVRDSGYLHLWKASNQLFLDRIRMQFLIWRALDPSRKEKYLKNWNEVRSEME